jgi:hypothetical protein
MADNDRLIFSVAPIETILRFAAQYPIFPCRRTPEELTVRGSLRLFKAKTPLVPHGFRDASQDPDQIRAWWSPRPDALVGVPTGSRTRLIVIDYDVQKADQAANDWLAAHSAELLATRSHGTLSGGRHYLFRAPEGHEYRNGVCLTLGGVKRNGIDLRAEGGYIIWWPLHGATSLGDVAPLPAGLIDEQRIETRNLEPLPTVTPLKWAADRPIVAACLAYLDPNSYQEWIDCGMAIHFNSGGSDSGFDLWHAWSCGDVTGECPTSYSGVNDCRYKWGTFKHEGGRKNTITIASLIARAKLKGYEKKKSGPPKIPHEIEEPPPIGESNVVNIDEPRKALQKAEALSGRRTIEWRAGEMSRVIAEAQSALMAANTGIYQRGGFLVRVARLDFDVKIGEISRPAGTAMIVNVVREYMTLALGRAANWVQYDGRSRGLAQIDPPPPVSGALLATVGEWHFPVLTGLIAAPTLRADGSLLDRPGYDLLTGLYGAFDPADFEEIHASPSVEDAHDALGDLDDLFSEFVFLRTEEEIATGARSPHSSVAIAALMTAAVRSALPTAPATGIDAAKAGSGKTTLAKVICYVVTGHDPPVLTLSDDEAEFKKCLLAILMAGDSCVLVDNVDKPVDSASLCAVLTSSTYSERLLGVNQRVTVPSTVTWLMTGNHLEFVGDLTSRVMLSILDPQEECPESRTFERDIMRFAIENRGKFLKAALTISLAYRAAGFPVVEKTTPSRFSEWDRMVRKPLLWLGRPDPLATQEDVRGVDPVRENLVAVLQAWRVMFGNDAGTVKEVVSRTEDATALYKELHEAFIAVAGNKDRTINGRSLGKYLTRSVRRIEGNLRLMAAPDDPATHRKRFSVVEIRKKDDHIQQK